MSNSITYPPGIKFSLSDYKLFYFYFQFILHWFPCPALYIYALWHMYTRMN